MQLICAFAFASAKSRVSLDTAHGELVGNHEEVSFEPRHEKTNVLVSDLVDTNQAVQLQKMAWGLKFQI